MNEIQQSILNKNRKDKFLLVLNMPTILKSKNSANERETSLFNLDSLQYSVYGTVVPDTSIPDVDVAYGGQVTKVTSYVRPAWEPITVEFDVDNGFNNWWVLWSWLNLINDSTQAGYNTNKLANPEKLTRKTTSYQTDVTVYGLDEFNNKKIQFDYKYVQITNLNGIKYNYRDSDQITSAFTFSFGQFEPKLL
jgi:hypothetical protein